MPRIVTHESPRKGGVFIATAAYSGMSAAYTQALFSSHQKFIEHDIPVSLNILTENCHVDDGRNMLVRNFLESDCEQLIFIDTDISWRADDLVKLAEHDADIVAGIYPTKKSPPEYPVIFAPGEIIARDGLVEAEGVPTGFLKVRRSVFEKLAAKAECFYGKEETDRAAIPVIFERELADGQRFSGDYVFCRKARASGFKVYIDPEMSFEHHGESAWEGRVGDYLRASNGIDNPRLIDALKALRGGRKDAGVFTLLYEEWANSYAASPGLLMTCYDISHETDGNILEVGAGLSTLIMGFSGNAVYSLESDWLWYSRIKHFVDLFGLDNVNLIYAPITQYDGGDFVWYDDAGLPLDIRFDVALIDGPCRAIGRKGFYELFDTSEMLLIVDDSETESHHVEQRDNIHLGDEKRPFIVSRPTQEEVCKTMRA